MDIQFSPTRPDADTLVLAVPKGGGDALPLAAAATLAAGAAASRFTGEAGTGFESFVEEGGRTLRVLLLGTGAGSAQDMEKAGGALVAKLATSGATHAAVEFTGEAKGELAAQVAFGAQLRSWRIDTYRTRQSEKAKPTLKTVTFVVTDAQAAWDRQALPSRASWSPNPPTSSTPKASSNAAAIWNSWASRSPSSTRMR